MASDMVEKVAIAIRSKLEFCDGCEPGDVNDAARAAIAVMKDPTEAMIEAAGLVSFGADNRPYILRDYQKMIDAALKD